MKVSSKKVVINLSEIEELERYGYEVSWEAIGWNGTNLIASELWINKNGEKKDLRERWKLDYSGLNKIERKIFKLIIDIIGGYDISVGEIIWG